LLNCHHWRASFDIKDGKIWIQRNMTEADLGQELVEMGVPKEDIVLGLHPPYKYYRYPAVETASTQTKSAFAD
jgi:XisI protein